MNGATYRHVIPRERKRVDESSLLHCVVPFNHTGCNRDVAGGRLPPLQTHRLVVPFNRTGRICSVAGGLQPLQTHRWVVLFNRTGCIRNAAGGKTPTQGRCVGVGVRSFSFSAVPVPVCRQGRRRLQRGRQKPGSPGVLHRTPCFGSGGLRCGCPQSGRQRSCSPLPE